MNASAKKLGDQKSSSPRSIDFSIVSDTDLNTDLFQRNLTFVRKSVPDLAEKIDSIKTSSLKLISNSKGEFDVEFRGDRFYGKGHLSWAKERVKNYPDKQGYTELILSPLDSDNLDDDTNTIIYRILKRTVDAGISFANLPVGHEGFHLVVFGGGLCGHLPMLAKTSACQHLIVVEPSIEFLRLSMYVFDWEAFLQGLLDEGRHFSLVINNGAREIADKVRDQIRYINPALVECTGFFTSYPNSVMQNAKEMLLKERDTLSIGLGFLEDEIDMVRNAFHNLREFSGRHYTKMDALDLPAFIIGSGPSLDNDLDFISENQQNALIISCGTSIKVLLNHGITPDFHVEIENVPAVVDYVMEPLSKQFDFSNIYLLASSTVDPRVSNYFKNIIYYFRSGLASYPMFKQGDDSTLHYAIPMVTNLGFSFAQEIGCRNIYNFGIDLGARDPAKHHAKNAPYGPGEYVFKTRIDQPVPGNFGGTVFSELVYLWAKQTMEFAMKRSSAKSLYYNCSDGIRLEGMIPKLSSTITLEKVNNKKKMVDDAFQKFPEYTRDMFKESWEYQDPRKSVTTLCDTLLKICKTGRPPKHDWDIPRGKKRYTNAAKYPLRYFMHILRELIPPHAEPTTELHYYRGSTFMCMAAINGYMLRLPKGPSRTTFLKIAREEFINHMIGINKRVQDFYDILDPPK